MNCLQCGKPAIETGETYQGARIRECEDKHRTGVYVPPVPLEVAI